MHGLLQMKQSPTTLSTLASPRGLEERPVTGASLTGGLPDIGESTASRAATSPVGW